MNVKKIVKQSIACVSGGLFLGCTGSHSLYPNEIEGLFQERIFFIEKSFVKTNVQSTIAYPTDEEESIGVDKSITGVGSVIIGTIAPKLIDSGIDIVAKSIVSLSGKDDQMSSISADVSNFFYKEEKFNMPNKDTPALNILFVSAVFGDSKDKWTPTGLTHDERNIFKALNIVGKPNFYMEAKIFPIPGNKYMEIVPTYMFYNRLLNSKGMDRRRDLAISFSFSDLESQSDNNLISQESIVFKDIQVGKEYGSKKLAKVRTTFMQMPTISHDKQGYSGAYNLKVRVTETRDINELLAALGESIIMSKDEIKSKLYVPKNERITYEEDLKKAQIELRIIEAKVSEAKANGISEIEVLQLESELVTAEAKVKRKRLHLGE